MTKNAEFEKEVVWAESTTGEDFQCVHIDFAREQHAEIARLHTAFVEVARMLSLEQLQQLSEPSIRLLADLGLIAAKR